MQAFLDGVIWFRGSLAEDSFFLVRAFKIVMSKSKKTQKIESRQTTIQDILKQTKGVWSHHHLKLFIGVALIAITLTNFGLFKTLNSSILTMMYKVIITPMYSWG
jgi:hypothetical protein